MFIGHYAASFAAKKVDKRISLGWLFLAAQFLDVLWALFVVLGIEKLRVDPTLPSSTYVLYYLPFTHGLLTALMWSGIVYLAFRYLPIVPARWRSTSALVMAATVFSHWVFDLVVHRPDLPLIGDTHKVGLALYGHPLPALALESALLFGGLWLYLRATRPTTPLGRYGILVFGGFLFLVNIFTYFGPPPPSPEAAAVFNEVMYFVLAGIALWLDRKRTPVIVEPRSVPGVELAGQHT